MRNKEEELIRHEQGKLLHIKITSVGLRRDSVEVYFDILEGHLEGNYSFTVDTE